MPQPLEAADPEQATALWRVRTASAGELLARRIDVGSPDQASDLVAQLRSLHDLTLYNVETVLGAHEEPDGVWVFLAPVASSTVGRLLASQEVNVQQRAILVLDLLAGLSELHGAGLGHARLTERTAIVDIEGRLRLAEPWRLPGEGSDPADEVSRAGRLACWILGVGTRPGGELTAAEQQAPALVAVARSLAAGAESRATDAFQGLREAAGRLAQRETLEPSRAEISQRVRQLVGLAPAATAPAPQPPPSPQVSVSVGPVYAPEPAGVGSRFQPAAASGAFDDEDVAPPLRPPRPSLIQQLQDFQRSRRYQQPGTSWQGSRPKGPRIAVFAAGGAVLLLLLLVAVPALVRLAQGPAQGSNAAAQTQQQQGEQQQHPTQAPAKPSPTPTQPRQQLAGAVTGFQLTPQGGCAAGGRCTIRVQVNLQAPQQPTDVTWNLQVTDLCHGNQTTTVRQEPVTAQRGWTYVFGIDSITLPSGKVQVVAQTTTPASATSDPVSIGNGC